MAINIVYDSEEFETFTTEVISTREYHKRGKNAHTRYYATLQGFGTHPDPIEVSISESDYNRLRNGDNFYLNRHLGLLDIPWYEPN
jgi:hypothetical protein